MKFTLTIEMNTEAFQEGRANTDLALMLHRLAAHFDKYDVEVCKEPVGLMDSNGNIIGEWSIIQTYAFPRRVYASVPHC